MYYYIVYDFIFDEYFIVDEFELAADDDIVDGPFFSILDAEDVLLEIDLARGF